MTLDRHGVCRAAYIGIQCKGVDRICREVAEIRRCVWPTVAS